MISPRPTPTHGPLVIFFLFIPSPALESKSKRVALVGTWHLASVNTLPCYSYPGEDVLKTVSPIKSGR